MRKGVMLAIIGISFAHETLCFAAGPTPGWAHRNKIIDLRPNGAANIGPLDRQLIEETFSRWGIASDEARGDVIRSIFEADADYEIYRDGQKEPIARFHGREHIADAAVAVQHSQHDQRRHAISNVVIDAFDGTTATAIAYGIVTIAKDDRLALGATVFYRGELRKGADGNWRFKTFVLGLDSYIGPKTVPTLPSR